MPENNQKPPMPLSKAFVYASFFAATAYTLTHWPQKIPAPNSANAVVAADQAITLKAGQRIGITNGIFVPDFK